MDRRARARRTDAASLIFCGKYYIPKVQTRSLDVPAFRSLVRFSCAALVLGLSLPRIGHAQAATRGSTGAPRGETTSGIACDAMEGNRVHIHQHLVLLDHGKPVPIPADVGQVPARGCLYWLHTHTPDGVIHIESPAARTFTLAEFFAIWGQPVSRTQVASMRTAKGTTLKVWVNGKAYKGDPAAIPLVAHADIVIEAGPPFQPPPKFTDWGSR